MVESGCVPKEWFVQWYFSGMGDCLVMTIKDENNVIDWDLRLTVLVSIEDRMGKLKCVVRARVPRD